MDTYPDSTPLSPAAPPVGVTPDVIAQRAEARLRRSAYLALKNVTCTFSAGVLTLRGRLPSYHLKQLALTAVAGIEGVERVVNEIEVVLPESRRR